MMWTELLLLVLLGECALRIAWGLYRGGSAVYRAYRAPAMTQAEKVALYRTLRTNTWPREAVEPIDDHAALDYSSGSKRH